MQQSIKTLTAGALGAALALGTAQAEGSSESRWYVAPLAEYYEGDSDRVNRDEGAGLNIKIGKAMSPHWNLELSAFGGQWNGENATSDVDNVGLGVDALLLASRGRFQPYLLAGVGVEQEQIKGSGASENNLEQYFQGGVGVMVPFTRNGTALRIEARRRWLANPVVAAPETDLYDWVGGIGLHVPFGSKVVAAAPVLALPQDADGDGVLDGNDLCPTTPLGAPVSSNGCELDADGDGVVDSADRCPRTPAGAAVNAAGCPVDSDGDGVADFEDKCAGTPKGTRVDGAGCKLQQVITLDGVQFELNSSRLRAGAQDRLDAAVKTLKKNADLTVLIAGHTDSTGEAAYNQWLSEKRATAVRQYLVNKGVNGAKLTVKGFGETKPVASNKTRAGRAQNRRVEMQVQK